MSPSPRRDRNRGARWLCSQLVRLDLLGDRLSSECGLLEEIAATGAWVAVEAAHAAGERVDLSAGDFRVSAEVVGCRARENDQLLELRFLFGVVWSPEVWRPDHLYLPPPGPAQAGAGG